MSEASAVIEAPATPPQMPEGGFTFKGGLADIMESIGKEPPKVDAPPVVEAPKADEPPKAPEPVKAEAPPVVPPPTTPKEENLANLRKLVGEEKARFEKLQQEYSALQKSHDEYKTRVPETAAEEAKRLKEQYETERKTREQIETELKASSYERSPEYRNNFVKPVQDNMRTMVKLAQEAGIDAATAAAGVNQWDRTKFGEWYSQMDEFQRSQFSLAMHTAQNKHEEGLEAVKNANANWDKLQTEQKQALEKQREQDRGSFRKMADEVTQVFVNNESIKDLPEVQDVVRQGITRVAEQKFTPKELMEQAAAVPILHHLYKSSVSTIEAHEAKIAEQEKKIAEQDAWIKAQTGGQPFPGNGVAPTNDAKAPEAMPWDVKIGG